MIIFHSFSHQPITHQGIFDRKRVRTEVDMMVEDLQLLDKRNIQSQRLSGGMKRKLRCV